jgi:actin-related protein
LDAYYEAMIKYVFKNFAVKFQEVKSQFDAPIDIVIAGGTSMPKGFRNKVQAVINGLDLPFQIKEVKHSSDARNAVVKGCLTQAIISQKKLQSVLADKMIE